MSKQKSISISQRYQEARERNLLDVMMDLHARMVMEGRSVPVNLPRLSAR